MTGDASPKLFMVLVGGRHARASIEVHDIRFATGDRIEDTYDSLRAAWWGEPDSLHIDAYAEVAQIDGYAVTLSRRPRKGREKLFFVNLGGYDPAVFDEAHRNVLKVATSKDAARAAALADVADWVQPHRDTLFEVESVLALEGVDGWHVHLTAGAEAVPFSFRCRYTPISAAALSRRTKP